MSNSRIYSTSRAFGLLQKRWLGPLFSLFGAIMKPLGFFDIWMRQSLKWFCVNGFLMRKRSKSKSRRVLCQTDKIILQRTIGENWDQLQQPEETFEVKQVFVGENLFLEFQWLWWWRLYPTLILYLIWNEENGKIEQ